MLSSNKNAGADRIEFVLIISARGITPNHHDIFKSKKLLHIPLHVIIRPRGGDFNYCQSEIELMKKTLSFAKQIVIDGVCLGIN